MIQQKILKKEEKLVKPIPLDKDIKYVYTFYKLLKNRKTMTDTNNPEDNTPELNLDEVVNVEPDKLTEEQKTFLNENKENLTPEQKEKFGIKAEEQAPNPDEITPETRVEKKDDKTTDTTPEDEEVDPEDEKTIGKVVDKKLKSVNENIKQIQSLKDQAEVDGYLRDNPQFSKYRGVMLKYMSHPSYQNIPAHNIAAIIAAKDLMKIGAEKEREAQKKANDTKDGGTQMRKQSGKVDWHNAPKTDFENQRAKVLGQQGG